MPLCVVCGSKLVCSHASEQSHAGQAGGVESACALKKGGIWVHVMDDAGTGVEKVAVKVDGSPKLTDASGFSAFDPKDPATYTVALSPLPKNLADLYDPPTVMQEKVRVSEGEIAYLAFKLTRKAALTVKVAKKGDHGKLFDGAKVTVTGKASPDPGTTSSGVADLGKLSAGDYKVEVALSSEDQKGFFVAGKVDVTLSAGEVRELVVEAEPVNVVTPKIEAEYKVVLLDRKLSAHQADTETKIFADATRVVVSLAQSNPDHPYGGDVTVTCPKADVFTDEACTKKLAGALKKADFTGGEAKLWLRGTTAGKFDLEVTPADPDDTVRIKLDQSPAKLGMGVVEIQAVLHQQDASALAALQVDPDTEPVATYHTNLKDKALPDQKAMTDADKVKVGRLLHVQKGSDHARARLVLKKLDASQWPDGTDDYTIVARMTKQSGGLALHKKAEGNDLFYPAQVTVADLKGAEKELWVEGAATTTDFRHATLDFGLDRPEGGLAKTPKRNGDWMRFTVVSIKEVKMTIVTDPGKAVLWDDSKKRFYINTDVDPDGRELKSKPGKGKDIKVTAELSEKLPDVTVHFMLVPDKANHTKARWGNDLPNTFKYKDLDPALRHKDRADRKDVLTFSAKTDDKGVATIDKLVLSRFGGDKFQIAAYLLEDPHLAKYVDGHTELGKKKPALSEAFTVWRRIWLQYTLNQNANMVGRGDTETAFESAFVEIHEVDETTFDVGTLGGLVEHPEWQFTPGAGINMVVCVGDHNKTTFHGLMVAGGDEHSPKAHLVICDKQWDPVVSPVFSYQAQASVSTVNCPNATFNSVLGVFDPPLVGANFVNGGRFEWSDGTDTHVGALTSAEVTIEQGRGHPSEVKVTLPGTCTGTCTGCGGGTAINPTALLPAKIVLRLVAATGPWAGESGQPGKPHCLIVNNPDGAQFNNTIEHEVGHLHKAVRKDADWHGLPDHPDQYEQRGGQGSHCKKSTSEHATAVDQSGNKVYIGGSCTMFHVAVGNVTFCDNCKADLMVRDLSDFFQ